MSRPIDDILNEIFKPPAGTITEELIASVLTGQVGPTEELRILRAVESEAHLLEVFGQLWDELNPDVQGLDPVQTVARLAGLAEARTIGPERIREIIQAPGSPAWLVSSAKAYEEGMRLGHFDPSEVIWISEAARQGGWSLEELRAWDAAAKMIEGETGVDQFSRSFLADLAGKVDLAGDDERVFLTALANSRSGVDPKEDVRPEVRLGEPTNAGLPITVRFSAALQEAAREVVLLVGFVNLRDDSKGIVATSLERENDEWVGTIPSNAAPFSRRFRQAKKMILVRCGST